MKNKVQSLKNYCETFNLIIMKNLLYLVTNTFALGAVALAASALVFVPVWAGIFGAIVLFWLIVALFVFYRQGWLNIKYCITAIIGIAIWSILFQIFGIDLLAKFGITMSVFAKVFIPYHVLFVVSLPLILLCWHSEDGKTNWYRLFGIIFCYIVCALPWGISVAF